MAGSRLFTVQQKRDIVAAYESAPWGAKAGVLDAHGVTGRQLRDWRAARDAGILEIGATPRTVVATPRPPLRPRA